MARKELAGVNQPAVTSRTWRVRRSLVAIALCLGLAACSDANEVQAATDAPGNRVTLPDGRKLNLRCFGRGSPTVLLESGFGADSGAWHKVQSALSRLARVCAYDRAGHGYSDPGPLPRDGASIARDLDLALQAARIRGPYIVVGHSSGGLYGRIFAARRPGQISGLVLLDPTVERRAPRPRGDGLDGIRQRLVRCGAISETNPRPGMEDPVWAGCLSDQPSANEIALAQRPAKWRGQLSELDSIFGRTSEQVGRIGDVLSDVPAYVITASETADAAPKVPFGPQISIWEAQHQQIAGYSRHGFQTTVVSPHLVMIARPDVVVAAVKAMIVASRTGKPPAPLPASETNAMPQYTPPGDPGPIPNLFDQPLTAPITDTSKWSGPGDVQRGSLWVLR